MQQELIDYYRLIAVLEAQVTHVATPEEFPAKGLSLKRLHVWTMEPLHRLRLMGVLVDLCSGMRQNRISFVVYVDTHNAAFAFAEAKGGELISIIHSYVNHGDPFVQSFIHRFLSEVQSLHDQVYPEIMLIFKLLMLCR